ncbi:MAG: hypothetical protein BWY99_02545 [Synergistetes bacterium ADurb.BinA166]|nr:MAG: hypothetical protein BWY99_02545 [Synergistetes bacterium ADurb.BinA166]
MPPVTGWTEYSTRLYSPFLSWMIGASGAAAFTGSSTKGSLSYSALISLTAAAAWFSVSATTTATASPAWRTLSTAIGGWSHRQVPKSMLHPLPVTTFLTPGMDSALDVSIERIFAWGTPALSTFAWSIRGTTMSATYVASPVALRTASVL